MPKLHTEKDVQLSEELISFYTHELRTPLTSMRGYIQLLQMKIKEEKEKRWVDELYTQSLRLTNLIGDLSEVNRVCAVVPTYTFSHQSIRSIIDSAVKRFNLSYKNQHLDVSKKKKIDSIQADTHKLIYVFGTILEFLGAHNAQKITIVGTQTTMNHVSIQAMSKGIREGEKHTTINKEVIDHIVGKHRGTLKMEIKGDSIRWMFEFPVPKKV